MMTVNEVSKLSGVSVRTLHYYDEIGLLRPAKVTEAGYRLYGEAELERLQHILLFRELQFPLKEIGRILDSSDFDRNRALEQQITLLKMKKEHLDNLIALATGLKTLGVKNMDFTAFDTKKIDEYAAQAKATWGKTDAYREFEKKNEGRTGEDQQKIAEGMMELFVEFGTMSDRNPSDALVQTQVRKLQNYITEHYYTCTKQILKGLGEMYSGGGSMTENIDRAGGDGTAEFVTRAIRVYCGEKEMPA
ncbi:MAG: MerR family transcriptional regulator [Lachnospiraceae bacterium]|nr:MerR family transcriptional regulator [Lachnospiraceae bacterium]